MADSPATPSALATRPEAQEIKVISHSMLYYWWPVWFFGFVFAIWTYFDNNRVMIVDHESRIKVQNVQNDGREVVTVQVAGNTKRLKDDSKPVDGDANNREPVIRVSPHTWMGPLFFTILFLVVLITTIPLRGLWSLVVVISIALLAVIFTLFGFWDSLLTAMGDLHIFLNMAGYLAIATALFIAWFVSVYVFDRRTYMVFTPGQVKICEEVGGREKVYDTTNISLEKHRDDWFRHIILGFGTGDMTVKTAGADRHEIVMPNVAFIAFKIDAIEQMISARPTVKGV